MECGSRLRMVIPLWMAARYTVVLAWHTPPPQPHCLGAVGVFDGGKKAGRKVAGAHGVVEAELASVGNAHAVDLGKGDADVFGAVLRGGAGNGRGGPIAQLHGLLQVGHGHVGRDGFGLKQHLARFPGSEPSAESARARRWCPSLWPIDLLLKGEGIFSVVRD